MDLKELIGGYVVGEGVGNFIWQEGVLRTGRKSAVVIENWNMVGEEMQEGIVYEVRNGGVGKCVCIGEGDFVVNDGNCVTIG